MVDALNRRYRRCFRILTDIGSDILADGTLDYPPLVLERFDFVVASVHCRFRLGRDEQTRRISAGVSNAFTTILGHPTGTWRLELDRRRHRKALELGCMLSINPDAHSIADLNLVKWGTTVVRKGCVAKENGLNAMSLEQILRHLRDRAASRSARARSRASAHRFFRLKKTRRTGELRPSNASVLAERANSPHEAPRT